MLVHAFGFALVKTRPHGQQIILVANVYEVVAGVGCMWCKMY